MQCTFTCQTQTQTQISHSLSNRTMAIMFGSLTPNSNTMSLTLTTQPLNNLITNHPTNFLFCGRTLSYGYTLSFSDQRASSSFPTLLCSAANKPSSSSDIRYPFSLFLHITWNKLLIQNQMLQFCKR